MSIIKIWALISLIIITYNYYEFNQKMPYFVFLYKSQKSEHTKISQGGLIMKKDKKNKKERCCNKNDYSERDCHGNRER